MTEQEQKAFDAIYADAVKQSRPGTLRDIASLCYEAALTAANAVQPYTDSTPELTVGESSFESWYANYERQGISKQVARDAYAAGMGDPLVTYAHPQATEQKHFNEVRNSIGLMKVEDERNNFGNHATAIKVLEAHLAAITTANAVQPLQAQDDAPELEKCSYCGITCNSPCDAPPSGPCERACDAMYGADPTKPKPLPSGHVLYQTQDADVPDVICDNNGEVVLALCRVCNQGEADLQPTCPGKRV